MHVFSFEVLQKDLIQTKNYFCCGYTTIVIILAIILPIVKLGNTKPIATIWYFYQQKYWVIKSLSGHPKKCFCKTMALRKTLVEREESLSTGGFVKRIIFGKTLVEREEPCPQEDL